MNVPDGAILLTQLIHDFVVLRMIGSEHEKRMITHFTEVLKSLRKTRNKHQARKNKLAPFCVR